ncbi:hypothetical protein H1P_2400011 [Hyella patelloides LEGE 07179]|uniref:Uncharacterized protein n=1 Tax=Hyella patelloides LEGE 07179 TaxID=945734 RepID=A0A563VS44_9CYAN|nr:hypothetical protein [Hyella patelloides]VEP14109.1 hypothetical protein H1P_2400011 [Hyella patelloides LEGE 07179]
MAIAINGYIQANSFNYFLEKIICGMSAKPELFTNAMNEVEEMQKIMVSTLQKLSR